MPQILEQRISIDAHNREHTQRNQCDGHNDDADGGRHRNVFISRLRHHLGEDSSVEIISVRGVGYKLKCR